MPRSNLAHPIVVEDGPADSPFSPDVQRLLSQQGGTRIKMYKKLLGVKPPGQYIGICGADEWSEEIMAQRFGGGDYRCQCVNDLGQAIAGGGFDVSIAKTTRTITPPRFAAGFDGFGAQSAESEADPLAMLAREVRSLREQVNRGGGGADFGGGAITLRDVLELVRAQQPASQAAFGAGEFLKMLPDFMTMMRPKSSIEEFAGFYKMMRMMSRGQMPDDSAPEPAAKAGIEDVLMKFLESPMAGAVAQKLLESGDAKPAPTDTGQRLLPAKTDAPATTEKQTDAHYAEWKATEELKSAAQVVSMMLSQNLDKLPTLTAQEIAEQVLQAASEFGVAIGDYLAPVPDGVFIQLVIRENPALEPHVLKLLMAEGSIRQATIELEPEPAPVKVDAPPAPPTAAQVERLAADVQNEVAELKQVIRESIPVPVIEEKQPSRRRASPASKRKPKP
jgi:hypothetical protein